MKKVINSFINAVIGVYKAFRSERNLRFHFALANLIVIFAYFYGMSKSEWAILVLAIMSVITCEMLNTGIERAVDTATSEYSETAKLAKDISAGAVFICAVFAIIIGFILFFDVGRIFKTLEYIFTDLIILLPCLLVGIIDVLIVVFGGKKND